MNKFLLFLSNNLDNIIMANSMHLSFWVYHNINIACYTKYSYCGKNLKPSWNLIVWIYISFVIILKGSFDIVIKAWLLLVDGF